MPVIPIVLMSICVSIIISLAYTFNVAKHQNMATLLLSCLLSFFLCLFISLTANGGF